MITNTIRLTSHQKAILATIYQSSTKEVADDTLASDDNLGGALEQLIKLKMVRNVRGDIYGPTALGKRYAADANLIDDSESLTDEGSTFLLGNKQDVKEAVSFKSFYLKEK